ncbi:MAG: serine/threonine-protein phosphatase [Chitinispirillales bacterium]|nr:serine/threonine-protein phosphatase [Chitinispirillales bacterium]
MDNLTDINAQTNALADLHSQNEMLKRQLISMVMINELVKVLHSCTNLEDIMKTVLLSFQDLLSFDRAILFSLNPTKFRLEPRSWIGIDDNVVEGITVPLGFDGGDATDAIFLNRHIFVEETDPAYDLFNLKLQSSSYIVVPSLRKPTHKCWELTKCENMACSHYGGVNPYCWSNISSRSDCANMSEDDRRRRCAACPAFKVEGVFWLDRKKNKQPITSDDISNLTSIITLAGLVFENFRMINALDRANHELTNTNETLRQVNHDLEIAEAKIRQNLEQARSIQQKLLPIDMKSAEAGFDIGSRYLAANSVGGDYYDLFKIAEDTYGVIVADVSGHGIGSALIMSMVKVLLKTFSKDETSPEKTLKRINEVFVSEIATEHFITIFYAVFDVSKRKICFTSAGHCPVLFLNRETGECTLLKADGLFLGVFPDMMLAERELDYIPEKHRLVLYTDGLTEAANKSGEMYCIDRLVDITQKTARMNAHDSVGAIAEDHAAFCEGVQPEDDITLLVIDLK